MTENNNNNNNDCLTMNSDYTIKKKIFFFHCYVNNYTILNLFIFIENIENCKKNNVNRKGDNHFQNNNRRKPIKMNVVSKAHKLIIHSS